MKKYSAAYISAKGNYTELMKFLYKAGISIASGGATCLMNLRSK